jgi:hypothetical protein
MIGPMTRMTRLTCCTLALLAVVLLTTPALAASRDPLSPAETDQLRDLAQEPDKRIRLYVKFARARMATLDQLRADPRFSEERGERVHDLLEDFTLLIDELDRNMNMYADRKEDIRKSLKDVIEADTGFQLSLRTIKDAPTTDSAAAKEAKKYDFALQNAIEAVNSSMDSARALIDEITTNIKTAKEQAKKKK